MRLALVNNTTVDDSKDELKWDAIMEALEAAVDFSDIVVDFFLLISLLNGRTANITSNKVKTSIVFMGSTLLMYYTASNIGKCISFLLNCTSILYHRSNKNISSTY